MSPSQPDGFPWPPKKLEWDRALEQGTGIPVSAYVHVPFCTVRCGYCDFNTYTTGFGGGADLETYADSVRAEISHSQEQLGHKAAELSTVFFGGGTPTLLEPEALGSILRSLMDAFGLRPGAEITVEANPETLTEERVLELADIGVTRLSIGMQSADPKVLSVLERTHRPHLVPQVVQWARDADLSTSLDLIFGAPTETLGQWERSLQAAVDMEPDHVSAYSLIVEEGTKLAAQIGRGEVPEPDEDLAAEKYLLTDQVLADAGYRWYEISNYAKEVLGEEVADATKLRNASKHNLAYWRDSNWWGYGPGAHSHWGNLRWWNVKHPRAYAGRLSGGIAPGFAGEQLDEGTRQLERLMLGIRTSEGIPAEDWLTNVDLMVEEGLLETRSGRMVLTLKGRLMADYVTRVLAGWEL